MGNIQTFTTQLRAVQWDGSDESWDAICELYRMNPYLDKYDMRQEDDKIFLRLRYADMRVMNIGDWLVLNAVNVFYIYNCLGFSMLVNDPKTI